jgi:hypothetical protein
MKPIIKTIIIILALFIWYFLIPAGCGKPNQANFNTMNANKPKEINLANLAEATEQEILDHVSFHLLTQGEPSVEGITCKYRTVSGDSVLKCAAGALIGDNEYDDKIEKKSWTVNCELGYVPKTDHYKFIESLQVIHDSKQPIYWKGQLTAFALEHDLSTKVLDQFN